jgi:hypothetical protein
LNPTILEQRLLSIVNDAWEAGYIVTVEQVPLQPYAMSNYYTRISLREARGFAAETMLVAIGDFGGFTTQEKVNDQVRSESTG